MRPGAECAGGGRRREWKILSPSLHKSQQYKSQGPEKGHIQKMPPPTPGCQHSARPSLLPLPHYIAGDMIETDLISALMKLTQAGREADIN